MIFLSLFLLFSQSVSGRDVFVYTDDWTSITGPEFGDAIKELVDNGARYVINAFYMPYIGQGTEAGDPDARDSAQAWLRLDEAGRKSVVDYMHGKQAKLLLSVGGASLSMESFIDKDPVEWGKKTCKHARDYLYDGVDFDLEGLAAGDNSKFSEFLVKAITECRKYVPIITLAPQGPYFDDAWGKGWDAAVSLSDRVLVQYYNQGRYLDYDNTFGTADSSGYASLIGKFPDAKEKFVVGKVVQAAYASNGIVEGSELVNWLTKAEGTGYGAGISIWKAPQKKGEAPEPANYAEFLPILKSLSDGGPTGPEINNELTPGGDPPSTGGDGGDQTGGDQSTQPGTGGDQSTQPGIGGDQSTQPGTVGDQSTQPGTVGPPSEVAGSLEQVVGLTLPLMALFGSLI